MLAWFGDLVMRSTFLLGGPYVVVSGPFLQARKRKVCPPISLECHGSHPSREMYGSKFQRINYKVTVTTHWCSKQMSEMDWNGNIVKICQNSPINRIQTPKLSSSFKSIAVFLGNRQTRSVSKAFEPWQIWQTHVCHELNGEAVPSQIWMSFSQGLNSTLLMWTRKLFPESSGFETALPGFFSSTRLQLSIVSRMRPWTAFEISSSQGWIKSMKISWDLMSIEIILKTCSYLVKYDDAILQTTSIAKLL